MAWRISDAVIGSLVAVACVALVYGNSVQSQLHVVPSTQTTSAPLAVGSRIPVSQPRRFSSHSGTDIPQAELPDGAHIPEVLVQQQQSWIPYGFASIVFGMVAAVFANFRPRNQSCEKLVEVDLETAPLQSSRRHVLAGSMAGAAVATVVSASPQPAAAALFGGTPQIPDWEQVYIPDITGQDFTFYDVIMLDEKRGFLIGSKQTFLETNDGGITWVPRTINTQDDLPYRFTSISFSGEEGWMVGKPAILMHTTNGGKEWERVGLSSKLPGIPVLVHAVDDKGSAEMCTDQGGIYTTTNAAQTWKAEVEETVDATLNRTVSSGISGASYYTGTFGTVARNENGQYIGVSSRGNFYMTWEQGQTFWMPHNRSGARRIQSMGWRPDGGVWEIGRGGQLAFGKGAGVQDDFEQLKINSRGYGLLDVAWRKGEEVWTVGGSGTLIKSVDGGQKWTRQRSLDDIAANLYEVRFFNDGKTGFVLGNSGVLLRYIGK